MSAENCSFPEAASFRIKFTKAVRRFTIIWTSNSRCSTVALSYSGYYDNNDQNMEITKAGRPVYLGKRIDYCRKGTEHALIF